MSEENPPENLDELTTEEFARRLAAAFISTQMDVSLAYAYKKYVSKEKPAQYWIDLAIKIREEMTGENIRGLAIKTDRDGRWLEAE